MMSKKYGVKNVAPRLIFVVVFCFQFYSIAANTAANIHVEDHLCKAFASLSPAEQIALHPTFKSKCNNGEGEFENDQSIVVKRKPNFIRFGRSMGVSSMHSTADPNFLRFGRSPSDMGSVEIDSLLSEKRATPNANFLRFGKSPDPNFLRFGKRSAAINLFEKESSEPNFLRFGRKLPNNNFLRFGRSLNQAEKFDREYRKPNFLRFG